MAVHQSLLRARRDDAITSLVFIFILVMTTPSSPAPYDDGNNNIERNRSSGSWISIIDWPQMEILDAMFSWIWFILRLITIPAPLYTSYKRAYQHRPWLSSSQQLFIWHPLIILAIGIIIIMLSTTVEAGHGWSTWSILLIVGSCQYSVGHWFIKNRVHHRRLAIQYFASKRLRTMTMMKPQQSITLQRSSPLSQKQNQEAVSSTSSSSGGSSSSSSSLFPPSCNYIAVQVMVDLIRLSNIPLITPLITIIARYAVPIISMIPDGSQQEDPMILDCMMDDCVYSLATHLWIPSRDIEDANLEFLLPNAPIHRRLNEHYREIAKGVIPLRLGDGRKRSNPPSFPYGLRVRIPVRWIPPGSAPLSTTKDTQRKKKQKDKNSNTQMDLYNRMTQRRVIPMEMRKRRDWLGRKEMSSATNGYYQLDYDSCQHCMNALHNWIGITRLSHWLHIPLSHSSSSSSPSSSSSVTSSSSPPSSVSSSSSILTDKILEERSRSLTNDDYMNYIDRIPVSRELPSEPFQSFEPPQQLQDDNLSNGLLSLILNITYENGVAVNESNVVGIDEVIRDESFHLKYSIHRLEIRQCDCLSNDKDNKNTRGSNISSGSGDRKSKRVKCQQILSNEAAKKLE
jgi:hypothetical protein